MVFWELLIIAIGVSMDAFAISICKGLSVSKLERKHLIITGIWFGGSQAIMPLLGYLLGSSFRTIVESVDHWFSFILLAIIGVNMVRESREEIEKLDDSFSAKVMFPLAIADSIDALAVGITFSFLNIKIIPAVVMIGVTTFVFSVMGVKIGNEFGAKYKSKAEMTGGIILIAMGTMILVEHLGIL